MDRDKLSCRGTDARLAELLLLPEDALLTDADRVQARKLQTHLEACAACRQELAELRATLALLDAWEAPEPNPYFLTRLGARLKEERAAESTGWLWSGLARLRTRLAYGTGAHMRPLAAMALTVTLLVGGGAYLDVANLNGISPTPTPTASGQTAVVHDLQIMDNNAQLLNQLEEISSNDPSGD